MKSGKIRKMITITVFTAMITCMIAGCGKKDTNVTPDTQPVETEEPAEEANVLEENSHASINRLVDRYCDAIARGDVATLESIVDVLTDEEKEKVQSRAAFIESIDNIVCYTKNGPIEDSFIVFLCYDMKLINIETPAPDIVCLYISPKVGDDRTIHYGDIDESMQEYVAELEKDPDVEALYADVERRYREAREQDEALTKFIQQISGQVAAEEPAEEPEEEAEPQEAEQSGEPSEAVEEEALAGTEKNRDTRTTESVNIRKEPSTDAERLALAYMGDPIKELESYDNGWSKVEYKGLTGYVKTEFLE